MSEEKERTIAELQARYCTEVNYDASKFNSDLWDSGYTQALEDAARIAQQFAEVGGRGGVLAMEWISTKDRLPEDDSGVFAAVWWVNSDNPDSSRYGIHDCLYYEGGEGSGQKIFADCEGEEFEHTDVAYWMYKRDLAATAPRP